MGLGNDSVNGCYSEFSSTGSAAGYEANINTGHTKVIRSSVLLHITSNYVMHFNGTGSAFPRVRESSWVREGRHGLFCGVDGASGPLV